MNSSPPRMQYYDQMLRSTIEVLDAARNLMVIDNLIEVSMMLSEVLLHLEDSWAALSLHRTTLEQPSNVDSINDYRQ